MLRCSRTLHMDVLVGIQANNDVFQCIQIKQLEVAYMYLNCIQKSQTHAHLKLRAI